MRVFTGVLSAWVLAVVAFAQPVRLERSLITSGGNFGAPGNYVHVYTYDAQQNQVMVIDSALGDFSNAAITDGVYGYAHVGRGFGHPSGEDVIYKYDLVTNQRIDSAATGVAGSGKLIIWRDYLLVQRGFGAASGFFKVLDKNDLSQVIFEDAMIPGSTESMALIDSTVYVAYTENDSGKLASFDLWQGASMNATILPMDTLSAGTSDLIALDGVLYGSNQRFINWAPAYNGLYSYDPSNNNYQPDTTISGGGTFFHADNNTLWSSFQGGFDSYDVTTQVISTAYPISGTYFGYAARFDTLASEVISLGTDFASFSTLDIQSLTGTVRFTGPLSASATALGLMYNHAPVQQDTVDLFYTEQFTPIVLPLAFFDPDAGDTASVQQASINGQGMVSFTADEITWDPEDGEAAEDTILYTLCDRWGFCVDRVVVITNSISSTGPELEEAPFRIGPNPVQNTLYIESRSGQPITGLQMWDLSGKRINIPQTGNQVDVSSLSPGMYILNIESGEEQYRTRCIKR